MSRPVVLVVVVDEPWPARTGVGRRAAALIDAAGEVADVHVIVAPVGDAVVAAPRGVAATVVHRSRSRVLSLARIPGVLARREPLTMAFYRRADVMAAVQSSFEELRPDHVVVQGIGAMANSTMIPPARIIIDLVDALHESFASMARQESGIARQKWARDVPRLERWFRRRLPSLGAVLAVSGHDLESYRVLSPTAHLVLVPNGAELSGARPDPGRGPFVFVGDLTFGPNRRAVEWLGREVLPMCRVAHGVRTVGRGPAVDLSGVHHVGVVDDLASEWTTAIGCVVPVFEGGGTRLKVIEAMAAGVPVVSTTFGVSGLPLVDGRHYLAADTPESFASAMDRVVAESDLRRHIATEALDLVRTSMTWRDCLEPLRDIVGTSWELRKPT